MNFVNYAIIALAAGQLCFFFALCAISQELAMMRRWFKRLEAYFTDCK